MRASVRRTIVAIACAVAAISTLGLVALGGAERGTGDQARAQGGGPEPPGPFPDVYAPGDEYTVPGERDGTSTFPTVRYRQLQPKQPGVMDFAHYHSEAEMNWWMRKWAFDHPQFVDLVEFPRFRGHLMAVPTGAAERMSGRAQDAAVSGGVPSRSGPVASPR
jgi:hypothetical protein